MRAGNPTTDQFPAFLVRHKSHQHLVAVELKRIVRLRDRLDDYLRFVSDPAVPFDNNAAERTIRMPKLRIKVSGSMRTLTGAEQFAAIHSYTATAARQGIDTLDALIQAAQDAPPQPDPQHLQARPTIPARPKPGTYPAGYPYSTASKLYLHQAPSAFGAQQTTQPGMGLG